jgi:hypothetical protein
VRPNVVTARTIELLCDDCDYEWQVARPDANPNDRSRP